MNHPDIRKLINLCEARDTNNPEINYIQQTASKIVASLTSFKSGVYTKLAQKITRISAIEAELKELKAEVKQLGRENVAELFDAEDAANTRVVETLQFMFTLSKDPKATVTPQYKKILEELEKSLTPELLGVLNKLKEEMVTVTQRSASLKVEPRNAEESMHEGIGSLFTRLKNAVFNWGKKYDNKLDALKAKAGM